MLLHWFNSKELKSKGSNASSNFDGELLNIFAIVLAPTYPVIVHYFPWIVTLVLFQV